MARNKHLPYSRTELRKTVFRDIKELTLPAELAEPVPVLSPEHDLMALSFPLTLAVVDDPSFRSSDRLCDF